MRMETAEDLEEERKVGVKLSYYFGCEVVKLGPNDPADFRVYRPGHVALFEVKRSYFLQGDHKNFMIREEKIIDGLAMAAEEGLPFFLAVQWNDSLGIRRMLENEGLPVRMSGRTDRAALGLKNDKEPCMFMPMTSFELLE